MIEGNCYYCDKPVNNLAGNPNEWGIPLCHEDEPGKVKTHHIGCVSERLRENKKMKKALAWADEELSRLKTGKESQLVEEITKLQEEKKKFDKIYEEEMKTVGGILNDNEELQKKNEALTTELHRDCKLTCWEMQQLRKTIEPFNNSMKQNEELKDCLKEAVDLMEDIIKGKYEPDSFTTQPWKKILMIEEESK